MLASRFLRSGSKYALQNTRMASKKVEESKSFVMNLFRGRAVTEHVFPYPLNLDEDRRETLSMIIDPTQKFLEEVNDPFKNDENAEIPMKKLKQFAELGAFGAVVPEEYEGAGLVNAQMARLAEIVGSNDLGLGVVMGAHQSIGYKGILLFGTPEQKKKYLPDVATARKFAAFCLTEPSSGSDANSIKTKAVKSEDGKHYILNGGKIWISNGGFAEVFTVFAKTPVKQADGSVKEKVSAFIVERGFGGVTNSPPEKKMGIKGSNTAEVHFENTKIPVENLLGEEGEGFKVAMNILNNGRFGIPAAMTGCMRWCIQKTVDHVNSRVQFGKKIKDFGNVQEKLADMVQRVYATESVVYMLASNMDRGVADYQLEAAIGKVMSSENAWHVCDEAIQLYGGMGFMRETGLERVLRDIRIFRIFEGANDVMRLFVALTGIQHAGKHLQQTAKEIKGGGLGTLFGELKRRAVGGDTDFSSQVHSSLQSEAKALSTDVATFGKTVDALLLKHKKGIVERQYELTRLADAAIDIYSTIAVLSRASYVLNKHSDAKIDLQIAQLFSQNASIRIQRNLKDAAAASSNKLGLIADISKQVTENEGLVHQHIIDV
ncbi:unnamed protein product [Bursaphelenchus okinawaensis]|uniref:Very long-chain specific acyl-CoA dehydrogenase, mitochondrial n=1 Tax=Bursaphelenchus okinawaensis TaxID=465554 RepID=A0A811KA77_9BILA|nr:unnamed protein product [Bursaphelenchus okinawaensis]CAG9095814.1 unnamed protein product [Bursaphelenchus okinawaensis]